MNKKNLYRVIALGLTGIMAAGTICQPVKAAAPTVQVDESLYVNLDYYGGISDISVVKGCYLNGNTTIEDYGTYDEIIFIALATSLRKSFLVLAITPGCST